VLRTYICIGILLSKAHRDIVFTLLLAGSLVKYGIVLLEEDVAERNSLKASKFRLWLCEDRVIAPCFSNSICDVEAFRGSEEVRARQSILSRTNLI